MIPKTKTTAFQNRFSSPKNERTCPEITHQEEKRIHAAVSAKVTLVNAEAVLLREVIILLVVNTQVSGMTFAGSIARYRWNMEYLTIHQIALNPSRQPIFLPSS